MARDGMGWTTSQCLHQSDQSPWFFSSINADSTDLLSAAPAEVGKQGFLQIIYRVHHYLCSTYLATVIIWTAFQHRKLMMVAPWWILIYTFLTRHNFFLACANINQKNKTDFHFTVPSLDSCAVFFLQLQPAFILCNLEGGLLLKAPALLDLSDSGRNQAVWAQKMTWNPLISPKLVGQPQKASKQSEENSPWVSCVEGGVRECDISSSPCFQWIIIKPINLSLENLSTRKSTQIPRWHQSLCTQLVVELFFLYVLCSVINGRIKKCTFAFADAS